MPSAPRIPSAPTISSPGTRPNRGRHLAQPWFSNTGAFWNLPASIHLRLSAIRKLAAEAAENGWLDRGVAQGIVSLKGVRQSGNRAGNWLTREQARRLLARPDSDTIEGKRDRAMLAVLARLCAAPERARGARLQAHPAADGRWVFVDLVGKGKRIRTVPIPPFVKVAIDAWTAAAGLSEGLLLRRVRRRKYQETTPEALSERMIWHIVTKYAREAGLVDKLAPHDLRRTCAKAERPAPAPIFILGGQHAGHEAFLCKVTKCYAWGQGPPAPFAIVPRFHTDRIL
jgi:site-specific recombinase XerD